MGRNESLQTWSTGTLAAAAGITVRTLRHYEQIGLLTPSARTDAGHRVYSTEDVTRLYRILCLRHLGLSLDEVGATLESTSGDLASVVRRHIEELDREIAAQQRLRGRLRDVLAALSETDAAVPIGQVIGVLEGMTMLDRYLTPEQLTRLRTRRETLGLEPDRQRAELMTEIEDARQAGVDPSTESVRLAARRLRDVFLNFCRRP